MKKIYLVNYSNGEIFEDYEQYTFKYCYTSKEQANKAIEELKQDKDFLETINPFDISGIDFWITSLDLID